MIVATVALSCAITFAPPLQQPSSRLLAPIRVEAGGAPIDTEVGRAAPRPSSATSTRTA
jgi:hypothetical protein